MDLSTGTVVFTTVSGLLCAGLLVGSEWKRAESDRALQIALARLADRERDLAIANRRLRDADDCIAQLDEELTRLEILVDQQTSSAGLGWEYTKALKAFIVEKCLVQRPTKGRRWFTRVTSVRLKSAVVAMLRYDPRFESWEHELWGPEIDL